MHCHVAHRALQTEDHTGVMLRCNGIVQEAEGGRVEVAVVDPPASCRLSIAVIFGTLLNSPGGKLKKVIDRL